MSKTGLIPQSKHCRAEGGPDSRARRGARQYDTRVMTTDSVADAGGKDAIDKPARRSYNRRNLVAVR